MLYEVKVSYRIQNGDGALQKEHYVVENCERFSEVEEKLFVYFDYSTIEDFDVTDIKRSRIKEIANSRENSNESLFLAEVQDVFTTDDGVEKELKYKILFFALDIEKALAFITKYIEQGYDMKLVSLKKTKFMEVIK